MAFDEHRYRHSGLSLIGRPRQDWLQRTILERLNLKEQEQLLEALSLLDRIANPGAATDMIQQAEVQDVR